MVTNTQPQRPKGEVVLVVTEATNVTLDATVLLLPARGHCESLADPTLVGLDNTYNTQLLNRYT